ncbi:MAG: hypothetical protein GXO43_09925 [Crenarchaeota archaeon]|nr:hypothetical protein [Thermoproteota archaeon]
MTDFLSQLKDIIYNALKSAWDFFVSLVTQGAGGVANWIAKNIVKPILDLLGNAWASLIQGMLAPFKAFFDALNNGIQNIREYIVWAFHQVYNVLFSLFGPLTPLFIVFMAVLAGFIAWTIIKALPGNPL